MGFNKHQSTTGDHVNLAHTVQPAYSKYILKCQDIGYVHKVGDTVFTQVFFDSLLNGVFEERQIDFLLYFN